MDQPMLCWSKGMVSVWWCPWLSLLHGESHLISTCEPNRNVSSRSFTSLKVTINPRGRMAAFQQFVLLFSFALNFLGVLYLVAHVILMLFFAGNHFAGACRIELLRLG
jgi:hypothetical protein